MRLRNALLAGLLTVSAVGAAAACDPVSSSPSIPWQSTTWAWVKLSHTVGGVGQDGVTVTERDSGRPVPALLLCKYGDSDVACTSGHINGVRVLPLTAFQLGQYYRIRFADRLLDSGKAPTSTPTDFRAGPREEDQGANPVYTWQQVSNRSAMGGSYAVETRADARATLTVPGSSITIYIATSSTHGLFDVYVDGVKRRTVNGYSPTTHFHVPVTLSGLSSGTHRVDLVVLGQKGTSAARGTNVVLDGASWAGGSSSTPAFEYAWGSTAGAYSGGWAEGSSLPGGKVSLLFRGTAINLATIRGPFSGTYQAYVDGKVVGRYDDSSSTYSVSTRRFTAAGDWVHRLSLVPDGRTGAHSLSSTIAVDYWQLVDASTAPTAPNQRVAPDEPPSMDRRDFVPETVPPAPEKTVPAPADVTTNGAS